MTDFLLYVLALILIRSSRVSFSSAMIRQEGMGGMGKGVLFGSSEGRPPNSPLTLTLSSDRLPLLSRLRGRYQHVSPIASPRCWSRREHAVLTMLVLLPSWQLRSRW